MATRMLASTVAGGQVIRFTSNTTAVQGYQECGLAGKAGGTATGLANATTYYFKVNCNGTGVVEKSITTAADTTFTAVIALMNAQMTGALLGVVWGLSGGDLRCTSPMWGTSSSIALSAGTSGNNFFAALTGFAAFDAAVAGLGPSEDPSGWSVIPVSGTTLSYPITSFGNCVVQVFGDNGVTGNITVQGSAGGGGPWSTISTVNNPTTGGTLVAVTAGVQRVRCSADAYTGGPARASIMANFDNGNQMW